MLPASQRLRSNRDFRLIYARGRSYANEYAVLHVLRRKCPSEGDQERRIGFVVSKKQGDAVVRNRIKRRLREAVRQRLERLRVGPFDMIIIGRNKMKTAEWPEVGSAVEDLLRRAQMLNAPAAD